MMQNRPASIRILFLNLTFIMFHKINAGASFSYDKFDEIFTDVNKISNESVPGLFLQYTYNPVYSFSVIGGIRSDFSNVYGTFITPRLHIRYSPLESTSLRLSIGKGYRTATAIASQESILYAISKVDFANFIQTYPKIGVKLLYEIGKNLSNSLINTNKVIKEQESKRNEKK